MPSLISICHAIWEKNRKHPAEEVIERFEILRGRKLCYVSEEKYAQRIAYLKSVSI